MSLLDNLMSMVTPQQMSSIAGQMGESPDAIQKGLQGGLASVLGAIGSKTGDAGFLQQIIGLVTNKAVNPAILSDIGGLASGSLPQPLKDLAAQFMSMLFGSPTQQASVSNLVGQTAGLKGSSATALMGMAAPMVMGLLGKQAASGGLTPSSLGSMLSAEMPSLSKFMPSGLSALIGSAIPHSPSMPKVAAATVPVTETTGGGGWVLPALIGLLLLGGLIWWFMQGKEPVKEVATKATETATTAGTAVTEGAKGLWAALGEFFKRKLPDGTELNIPKLGVENRLIDFIDDAGKPVTKETWFDFDRLLFDTGKATLQPDSSAQLKDVAAIMKAYPKVHMRIGGYTDNTGDKAANVKLSQDRAANVMAELVKLGTDASRLDAKGYGDEHPVASNDTDDGRAKNRRISMRVTAK